MNLLVQFIQHLYHFEDLIRWGGQPVLTAIIFAETGLMAGFFLPGDSLLVTAGVLSAAGLLDIRILLSELILAAIIGDSTNYVVGKHIGPRIFNREDSLLFHKNHLLHAKHFYEKYGPKAVVIGRFVPIARTFVPTVAGVGQMKYLRFLTFSILGGIAWVGSMLLTGYFLGRSIPNVEKHVHQIILVVIVVSFIPMAVEWWKSRSSGLPRETSS